MDALSLRRRSLFLFFLIPGLALASWVTRTPGIRDATLASVADMGLMLFGLSVGSMAGILTAGRIVAWRGTKFTALAGLCGIFAALFTIAAGAFEASQAAVCMGFGLFGLGMGFVEISINLEGAAVEAEGRTPILHILHGAFSLGTLLGALVGYAMTGVGVSIQTHLGLVIVTAVGVVLWCHRHIPAGNGMKARGQGTDFRRVVAADPAVLLIGFLVFSMALAEGTANDWLPILLVDEHGFSGSAGAFGFVCFAVAMTIGRFGGGYLIRAFGRRHVMAGCCIMAAVGIALLIFGSGAFLAGVSVVLWGLGISLGFPLALSAAGDTPKDGAARVEVVAVIGYIAMLVGPPSLGFLGEHYGLRMALLVVLGFVTVAIGLTGGVRTAPTSS